LLIIAVKVEELQTKLTSNLEDLMSKQNMWMEATSAVRKKDDELRSKDNMYVEIGLRGWYRPVYWKALPFQ